MVISRLEILVHLLNEFYLAGVKYETFKNQAFFNFALGHWGSRHDLYQYHDKNAFEMLENLTHIIFYIISNQLS